MNTMYYNLCLIGLSYMERPILGDKHEAHNHDNEKHLRFS